MRQLAVIGPLARDVVAGAPPRIGGGPWHAGRALRALGRDAVLAVKCGTEERSDYLRRLAALGLPATVSGEGETTSFSFRYDADGRREMHVDALGAPWTEADEPELLLRRVEWLHLAPLLRDDFAPDTLERLARGRRILLDGQGLVRSRRLGRLSLDGEFDRTLLRHVSILKLAEDEARAIVGDADLQELSSLGVPEIVVTFGSEGSLVLARGTSERIRAHAVTADPTGAGDAFAAAYLAARASGHRPASAGRRATGLVTSLLGNSLLLGRRGR